jgi:hypothetical protein
MLCLLYGGGGCRMEGLLFTWPVRINISKGSSASLSMEQMWIWRTMWVQLIVGWQWWRIWLVVVVRDDMVVVVVCDYTMWIWSETWSEVTIWCVWNPQKYYWPSSWMASMRSFWCDCYCVAVDIGAVSLDWVQKEFMKYCYFFMLCVLCSPNDNLCKNVFGFDVNSLARRLWMWRWLIRSKLCSKRPPQRQVVCLLILSSLTAVKTFPLWLLVEDL